MSPKYSYLYVTLFAIRIQVLYMIYNTYINEVRVNKVAFRDLTLGFTRVNIPSLDLLHACGWVMVIFTGLKV